MKIVLNHLARRNATLGPSAPREAARAAQELVPLLGNALSACIPHAFSPYKHAEVR